MRWWEQLSPVMKDMIVERAARVMSDNARGYYPPPANARTWGDLRCASNGSQTTRYGLDLQAHCCMVYLEMREELGYHPDLALPPPPPPRPVSP